MDKRDGSPLPLSRHPGPRQDWWSSTALLLAPAADVHLVAVVVANHQAESLVSGAGRDVDDLAERVEVVLEGGGSSGIPRQVRTETIRPEAEAHLDTSALSLARGPR